MKNYIDDNIRYGMEAVGCIFLGSCEIIVSFIIAGKLENVDKLLMLLFVGFVLIMSLELFNAGVWFTYHAFQTVRVDENGIICKFLWKTLQCLKWSEIQEWGIGWQYSKPDFNKKPYHSLQPNDTKMVEQRSETLGDKYIYFSIQPLSEEEKGRIAEERFRRKGLLTIRYSEKRYIDIFNLKKAVCPHEKTQKEYSSENIKSCMNLRKTITFHVDIREGIKTFLIMLFLGEMFRFLIESLTEYDVTAIFMIYLLVIIVDSLRYFKKVMVTEKGIKYRRGFFEKISWNWNEIQECAVLINYYHGRMKYSGVYYDEERYIYFAKHPFDYEKKEGEVWSTLYFNKKKDIIMVRYSDKLYWNLKKLGVLGIKE